MCCSIFQAVVLVAVLVVVVQCTRSKFLRVWGLLFVYAFKLRQANARRGAGVMDWGILRDWARRTLTLYRMRVEHVGLEGSPAAEPEGSMPVLFLCNHQSAFDVPTLVTAIPRSFCFMPKQEIRRIPVVGKLLADTGHVYIDRRDPVAALRSMNEVAVPALQQRCFLIFPEGTRSRTGIIPFKKGAFHMAKAAKARIVPLALAGADDTGALAGSGEEHTVRVAFGEPIQCDGTEDIDELIERTRQTIIALNESIGGSGAQLGTETTHAAVKGNPAQKSQCAAWLKF